MPHRSFRSDAVPDEFCERDEYVNALADRESGARFPRSAAACRCSQTQLGIAAGCNRVREPSVMAVGA